MQSKPLAAFLWLFLIAMNAVFPSHASAQNNPVPLINQPLVPDAVAPGGPAFTLIVNGTGFVVGSTVNWNGSARTTTFVSGSQVKAAISAADIAAHGTASVTVVNPTPGGGVSNLAFLLVTDSTSFITTSLASSPATGVNPYSVAVGDFNGDGKLDLAVVNNCGNDPACNNPTGTVSILLGDGAGNFSLASSPATGIFPSSVAVGDFNGDGKLDLAVANQFDSTVSILLGDGTGHFSLVSSPSTAGALSVAVGDFNGDGKLDLAVAGGSGKISILLGDGTGKFTLASSPAAGNEPISVAVGDFNGDGKLDLAVANLAGNTVSVLLGDGTGNFTLVSSPSTGDQPWSVAVGDFNGDGKLDLAVVNRCGNIPNCDGTMPGTVSILLGDGTGNFSLVSSPATGDFPFSVAVGDFNGDGRLDLTVTNVFGNSVSILLGDGTGNFSLVSLPGAGIFPWSVAVGDFIGDGRLDLATANEASNTVSILVQAPILTLSSGNLAFGNENIGMTSAPQMVTLTNSGSAPLILTISITGQDPADFTQSNTCGTALPSGGSCTITVTFTPNAPGDLSAAVTITDNASGSPQMVALTGTGIGPFVTLSATSLAFPKQVVGTASQPKTVMLTNSGNQTLNITSIVATGDFSQMNTCGTSLPAGDICTIIVTFLPTRKGRRTGSITISDNAFGSPQMVSLSGTGTVVKLSPKSLNFGSVQVGKVSPPKHVTLTNVGNIALDITAIALTGSDPRDFLETNTCGSSVAAGASCTITVRFVPTVTGLRTAAVSITDNGGGSLQEIKLSGTGT